MEMNYRIVHEWATYAVRLPSVMLFLCTFAGHWPTRKERSEFSYKIYLVHDKWFYRYYLQVHFRCYTCLKSPKESVGIDGCAK
jgi:hypothetical protein